MYFSHLPSTFFRINHMSTYYKTETKHSTMINVILLMIWNFYVVFFYKHQNKLSTYLIKIRPILKLKLF